MADEKNKIEEGMNPSQQPKKATKKQPPQTLIYVGPNLQGGVLAKYTTFRHELPVHVELLKNKHEGLHTLIVPVNELQATQKLIAKEGTSQHNAYQQLLKGGN